MRIRIAAWAVLSLAVLVAITFSAEASEAPVKHVEGSPTPTGDVEARIQRTTDPATLQIDTMPFDGAGDNETSPVGQADTHLATRAPLVSMIMSTAFNGRITDASGVRRPIHFRIHPVVEWSEAKAQVSKATHDVDATRTVTTSEDGTFEIGGLPNDWEGWIDISGVGEFTSASWTGASVAFPTPILPVTLPAEDLRMTLRRFPVIRARLAPAAGAERYFGFALQAMTTAGGTETIGRGAFAADPTFEWPVGPLPLASVSLDFWAGLEVKSAKHIQIDGPIEKDIDLGLVTLQPARRISIRVVDKTGAPISDASVTLPGPLGAIGGERTLTVDAEGSGSFVLRGGICTLFVQAKGYRRQAVIVPESAPDRINVSLVRCTLLTASVKMSDGRVPSQILVRVRATDGKEALSAACDQIPISDDNDTWDEEDCVTKYAGRGVLHFCGLPADRPLSLEVHEFLGVRLLTIPITLREGEWRDLPCTLDGVESTVSGIVRDREGDPVEGAEIEFNGMSGYRETSADGRFAINGVFVRVGTLKVVRRGYIPLVREGFRFPDDGADVAITLDRGRLLAVRVVDARGAPFVLPEYMGGEDEAVTVEVPAPGRTVYHARPRQRYGPPPAKPAPPRGTYLFDGLPEGEVVIRWLDAARHTYERRQDTRHPEVSVAVPLHGSLKIALGMTLSEGHEYRITLRPSDASGASIIQTNYAWAPFGPRRIWRHQTCDFDTLIADTYEVLLERRDPLPSGPGSIERWTPVSKPAKVRVIAGAQSSLLLERKD